MQFEDVRWELKIAGTFHEAEFWLEELAALRGEVFYENGKRPAFLLANGTYYDRDEFETVSTHVLAYYNEKIIGAVRLLPLMPPQYACVSAKIIGCDRFATIMKTSFIHYPKKLEMNRFIVHKNYQHIRLGVFLCAAAFNIVDDLQYFPIANGNIDMLKRFHFKHLGGVMYPDYAGPYASEYYNDNEIYLIYLDKKLYSSFFKRQMKIMKQKVNEPLVCETII